MRKAFGRKTKKEAVVIIQKRQNEALQKTRQWQEMGLDSEAISVVELKGSGDQHGAMRGEGWVPDPSQVSSSEDWMLSPLEDKQEGGDSEGTLNPPEFEMTVGHTNEIFGLDLEIWIRSSRGNLDVNWGSINMWVVVDIMAMDVIIKETIINRKGAND